MSAKPADLTCKEVVELVNEYLGHALTAELLTAFEAHLATCAPCDTYLAQMKTVLRVAGSLGKPQPSEEAERELLALFRRWHEKSSR